MAARLADEVAVVTGSTSGLGRAVAQLFAEEGCAVVLTGRDAERGEAAVAEICAGGAEAVFVRADLADEEQCARLVGSAVSRFGGLTVLVNNAVAGAGADGPVTGIDRDSWERILALDLVAAACLCRHAIPCMIAAGHGSIVNVSSRAAELGTPGLAAYSAAKAGLDSLSRSVTIDYARRGVRCNTVQPGYVLHEVRDADLGPERRRRLEEMQLTRITTARDVAYAVLYLASREAEVVTGANLRVDGGSTAVRARLIG